MDTAPWERNQQSLSISLLNPITQTIPTRNVCHSMTPESVSTGRPGCDELFIEETRTILRGDVKGWQAQELALAIMMAAMVIKTRLGHVIVGMTDSRWTM
jgi:hypothetical protein